MAENIGIQMGAELKVGDRVAVNDPGLAMLRQIMERHGHEAKPNHHGVIHEIWDDTGDALIYFDDGVGAPYPLADCERL